MSIEASALVAVLREKALLSEEEIQSAITKTHQDQLPLLHYLVTEQLLTSSALVAACADYFGLRTINLREYTYEPEWIPSVSDREWHSYLFMPVSQDHVSIVLAISDPDALLHLKKIKFNYHKVDEVVFVPYDEFIWVLNRIISERTYAVALTQQVNPVDLVKQLLTDAVYQQASDIHFEAFASEYRVRFRVDGVLRLVLHGQMRKQAAAISNHLKALANMDLSEKRLPQDGRFNFTTVTGIMRHIRLSTCPTLFGEKVVVRLLNPARLLLRFDALGLASADQATVMDAIQQPQGLVLVTGPTGSGKTVLLYAMLAYLNHIERNIVTVEDPIEMPFVGINQVAVHAKIHLNFAVILRALLRQDPDIIMVGEIRDLETAEVAIRAAHTGHLVLSTLHANHSIESLTRLMDMGVQPFHLASVLTLVIAQRLLRRSCAYCHAGIRCNFCRNGYRGRIGVYELLSITDVMRRLILKRASPRAWHLATQRAGMQTLWQSGLAHVHGGITTLEELGRVLGKDHEGRS